MSQICNSKKFISGLGREIYGMFGQKVLKKSKRLRNPKENGWKDSKTNAMISFNGLYASDNTGNWLNIIANKGFTISGNDCRMDKFPGTIVRYFEVTKLAKSEWAYYIGLSNGNIADSEVFEASPNCYVFPCTPSFEHCWLSEEQHAFKWPNEAIKPKLDGQNSGIVIGCGLWMNSENKLAIFFTGNGILMGSKPIQINPTVDCLYPTVQMRNSSLEANFGDNSAKPFKYDIVNCPGLVFE